ncbi:MAG: lysophospholipid acyltransferase family protein [Desulfomonilia bacterium]
MHYTVFDTPVVRPVFRWISRMSLKAAGWKVVGEPPRDPKYVIVAAFHTSNWDFPIGLFMAFALGVKIYWIGKDSLFRRPFGPLMRWLGGIPVNRRCSHNMVSRTIEAFQEHESLGIAITPEGTRGKAPYWKTGFYHIAVGAGVPIVLAFLDYRLKTGGIGPVMFPTGDIEADMVKIRDFYADVTAKYPEYASPPILKPGECRKAGT